MAEISFLNPLVIAPADKLATIVRAISDADKFSRLVGSIGLSDISSGFDELNNVNRRAANGESQVEKYDLVFLHADCDPDDGLLFLQEMRKKPYLQDVSLIVMSPPLHQHRADRLKQHNLRLLSLPIDGEEFEQIMRHVSPPLVIPTREELRAKFPQASAEIASQLGHAQRGNQQFSDEFERLLKKFGL
jgi:hypothetical protein